MNTCVSKGNDDLPLRLSSRSQHCHAEASPILTLTAQPMIGTERLHSIINNAPAGCSSAFYTFLPRRTNNDNSDHNTTGLCVTFRGVDNWKSSQLKLTAQSTTEFRHWPIIDTSNGLGGSHFGGAQGMAWFCFCHMSSVRVLSVFYGLVFDGRDNALEEC
jgi:hypothetical protein